MKKELLIVSDPRIMVGKPIIKGTRITVEHIVRELGGGRTIEELLAAHPHITREQIIAALEFAIEAVRFDRAHLTELSRDMLITSNPQVMVGKPVIRGTRITVELIMRKIAAGRTREQILEDYPHITREGIRAAVEFAAESVRFEHVTPFEDRGGEEGS